MIVLLRIESLCTQPGKTSFLSALPEIGVLFRFDEEHAPQAGHNKRVSRANSRSPFIMF